MPDTVETKQRFLKGINRRMSRDSSVDPDYFWALQNARIYSRGNTGQVKRIGGYTKFNVGSTIYAKTLAMETFKSFFIVFYESNGVADEFNIDVIDSDGNVVFTDSYSGESTTEGELTVSDENIFISPHNKVLYYNEGSWVLTDYISEIGGITDISLVDNTQKADGTISIESGVTGSFSGKKSTAAIRVVRNNTPSGETDVFQISVGGNTTGDITVEYTDTLHEIKDKIYNALVAVTAITNDWDISKSFKYSFTDPITGRKIEGQPVISFASVSEGSSYNSQKIALINSAYNIDNPDDDRRFKDAGDTGDTANTTLYIRQPDHGEDSRTDLGPLYIYFFSHKATVQTANLVDSDTYLTLGNKVLDALNDHSQISGLYDIAGVDTGTQFDITLTAKRGGEKYNTEITKWLFFGREVSTNSYFTSTFNAIDGGVDSATVGTLEKFTHYWYRVRYRFKDGHVTTSSLPVYKYSDVGESITLTINTSLLDIDGDKAQVEIFRKQGEGDFFLIERLTPDAGDATTVFTDDGKGKKASLEEKNNIWTAKHNSQAIIDNRYLRGGVEYFNEVYSDISDLSISVIDATDLNESPKLSQANIYVRPQYKDGTFGYHSLIGSQDIENGGKKLRISQSAALSNPDKEIKNLGLYARYLPKEVDNFTRFHSIELTNNNIPTIAQSDLYPGRTRILFGFKHLFLSTTADDERLSVTVGDWGGENVTVFDVDMDTEPSGPFLGSHPRVLTVNIFGVTFRYLRVYTQKFNTDWYRSIYKLEIYDALKDAVKTKQLKIRLGTELSSTEIEPLIGNSAVTQITKDSGKDILSTEAVVTNIIDESLQYPEVQFTDLNLLSVSGLNQFIFPPSDSRIYLELEESNFDDIENQNINDYAITSKEILSSDNPIPFDLIGFDQEEVAALTESAVDYSMDGGAKRVLDGNTYYAYQWSKSIYGLINKTDLKNEDRLIYLGSKENDASNIDLEITGFQNIENDALNFVYNNPFNIYDLLVEKEDINVERTTFSNQIIWSGQILSGTRYSQERNIDPENFFSLPGKYGRILRMEPLRGRLYVFCEYGVVVCAIGETIARQKGGQVVVTDSNFITSYFWIFEDLNDVKFDTIIKHGTRIFFTDGRDIYQIGRESGNISQGALPLDPDHIYKATIDDQNDEYRLSDITDGVTWVYNFEAQQFYGPHTYVCGPGENLKKKVISVVGDDLVQFGQGNTFAGATYATIIASVANDTEQSFLDKAFRKFYIETENDTNAVFRYGKDYNSLITKNLSAMISKNGYKYQGVQPSEKNGKIIYWELESEDDGFLLNDMTTRFKPKGRR